MVFVTMQQCCVEKAQVRGYIYYPHLWELSITTIIDQPRCVSALISNPPDFSGYNRLDTTQASYVHYECCLVYSGQAYVVDQSTASVLCSA